MNCLACPREKMLRQREKYFVNVHFQSLSQLLHAAMEVNLCEVRLN